MACLVDMNRSMSFNVGGMQNWMEREQEQEGKGVAKSDGGDEASSSTERSTTPTSRSSLLGSVVDDDDVQEKDVLCGRDRYIHAHKGNQQFRHLINLYRERYQSAKHRDAKTSITLEIVGAVREYGGRFLKQQNGRWREVDQAYAHEKVSHALRSAKDPNRPKPKRTRNVEIRPPSEDEERFFQLLAVDQHDIYQRLRRNRANDFNF